MVEVFSSCPSGSYSGSGFLVGPQVLITALHVVEENGSACSVSVTQEGTGQTASVASYSSFYTVSPADTRATDFAVAALDQPLSGYYFRLASVTPRAGARIITLGYPLGEALSFTQGHVISAGKRNGVPTIALSVLATHGNSGGPILNVNGDVVGLTQSGAMTASASIVLSLNLPRFTGGRAATLCQGVAVGKASTLCGGAPSVPPAVPPASPGLPQPTSLGIEGCWVTEQAGNWDPAAKIYQTAARYPSLYFVTRLTGTPGADLTAQEAVYNPYGWLAYSTSWTWTGQYQSWSQSFHWNSYAQGGKWLFRIDLSNGLSCQYVVNIVR